MNDGTNVELWSCNGQPWQKVIDASGAADGANARTCSASSASNQLWNFVP